MLGASKFDFLNFVLLTDGSRQVFAETRRDRDHRQVPRDDSRLLIPPKPRDETIRGLKPSKISRRDENRDKNRVEKSREIETRQFSTHPYDPGSNPGRARLHNFFLFNFFAFLPCFYFTKMGICYIFPFVNFFLSAFLLPLYLVT